jgi:hypothetical protein
MCARSAANLDEREGWIELVNLVDSHPDNTIVGAHTGWGLSRAPVQGQNIWLASPTGREIGVSTDMPRNIWMRLTDKYKADCLTRAGLGHCERTGDHNLKENL